YFKKAQTIIFKYRDVNNGIEMMKSIKIPNFPPVLEKIEQITTRQGKIINIVPKATDIDKDDLFFTFSTPLDEEGRWEDTIKYDPGLYTVKVTVSDGQELISQDVVINLTGEYADSRKSIMDRKLEYESEVEKAESIRLRRESKQFSLSRPGTDLEFNIGSSSIVLSKITFNVNKELLKYTIEVRGIPLSSRPREYEKAPGQVYQYVQINLMNAENEEFENITLQFHISKKWLEENNVSPYSVKFYEYFEGWDSMGSAKMTDFGDYHVYEVLSDTLEGFYAISIDNTVAITGAAVAEEQKIDFEIVNEGDGDFVDPTLEEAPAEPEPEVEEEEKKGFFGKSVFMLIILVIVVIGYFVFSGRKGSEEVVVGGTEGDREAFTQEVRESRKEMRRKEREARREGKRLLAEEKRKRREEERGAKEEGLRLREEEKQRMREEDQKRAEEARRMQETERRMEEQGRAEPEVEEAEPSYDDMNLGEAALIEERRRLARLEDEKRERETLRRREEERVKREEERRMKRRAKSTTKKKPKKKAEEPKPKKSNVKIISEDDWKERMRKKRKQSEDELTIERMDDDV
ncbi:MAG: PGF-pre-PGF domain-containing protein, partial [Nanoarchaeota archaeon]|nr:PGF-pre-PGF domain-containing protein [Nanoarchaeota archaeon]